MGMFDTFLFKKPIKCTKCNNKIIDVQCKQFDCTMEYIKPYDVLRNDNTVIIDEDVFCDVCSDSSHTTFLCFKNGIYLGETKTYKKAKKKIKKFKYHNIVDVYKTQHFTKNKIEYKLKIIEKLLHSFFYLDGKETLSDFEQLMYGDLLGVTNIDILNQILKVVKDEKYNNIDWSINV